LKKIILIAVVFSLIATSYFITKNVTGAGSQNNSLEELESSLLSAEEDAEKLKNINPSEFKSSASLPFEVTLEVTPRQDGDIEQVFFDIKVQNPQKTMHKIAITAVLDDKLLQYLDTSHLYFSNIDSVLDSNAPEEYFTLKSSDTNKKSVAIGRSFLKLNELNLNEANDSEIKQIILNSKVKVTWIDDKSELHSEYIAFSEKNFTMKSNVFQ